MEIVARCCRQWVDEDTLDNKALALAEQVLKAGMALLPKEPYMVRGREDGTQKADAAGRPPSQPASHAPSCCLNPEP